MSGVDNTREQRACPLPLSGNPEARSPVIACRLVPAVGYEAAPDTRNSVWTGQRTPLLLIVSQQLSR